MTKLEFIISIWSQAVAFKVNGIATSDFSIDDPDRPELVIELRTYTDMCRNYEYDIEKEHIESSEISSRGHLTTVVDGELVTIIPLFDLSKELKV